ncbi:hypothetical protein [Nitratireductor sp. StC3]|uniref:hypothetical protein n=1 Tax=Nitratireductor sp. StC3 TaxID=2126741 RepID=UPI000D0CEE1D|nr:hypothetical protein [Nitratireductor sp. StC3]PSM17538.1 hypothetical protein C7T96_14535 [Nitratireductor sp. StC3]
MKLFSVLVMALAATAGLYVTSQRAPDSAAQEVTDAPDGHYSLYRVGGAERCLVERAGAAAQGRFRLVLEPGCGKLDERFAQVRFGRDEGNGLLSFLSEDGTPVVEFAVADGIAYESVRPEAPIFQLLSRF